MKSFVTLIFLLTLLEVYSQNDTINKFDHKGKKTGFWKVFLDSNIIETDSLNSLYYGFQIYDTGQKLRLFEKIRSKRKLFLVCDGNVPKRGHPVVVNGTYKWYDKKHILKLEETYKNGLPLIYKVYDRTLKSDTITYLVEVADFSKQFDNLLGSHYGIMYSQFRANDTWEAWYRKIDGKWKWQRVK